MIDLTDRSAHGRDTLTSVYQRSLDTQHGGVPRQIARTSSDHKTRSKESQDETTYSGQLNWMNGQLD